jgi:hypothetical protein
MISLGRNIRQPSDSLTKISIKQLADKIRNPDSRFIDFIVQLRKVQTIDSKKYRELKTKLPYVVAAVFNPNFRKIEHFALTSYLIIDIDHLSEKEISINKLSSKLQGDNRIVLMFKSPSGDGLKLFFKFNEPFYDHGKCTMFYKLFAHEFGIQYAINQVVDKRTSDVSRACFVSYDPDIWYNINPEIIDVSKFIDFDNELQITEINAILKNDEKEKPKQKTDEATGQDMPDSLINQIREKLNPKLILKKERQVYVPEQLNTIIELVKVNLLEYNIEIEEIINISYGKQFRLKLNHHKAEINVFYGKKGFSVVKSTKSGCSAKLIDIAHDVIFSTIL